MKKTKLSKVAAVIAAGAACAAFGFAAVACGDEEHTHKWADAWTTNSTHHWHVCTAGDDCKDISGKDTHKDANEDGKCDVCQYVMTEQGGDEHDHVWATVWSSDATDHWHACTVEGCTETNDKAAHGEADEDGKCPTCEKELGGGGGEEAVANTAKLTFADTTLTVVYVVESWATTPAYITVYDSTGAEIEGATDVNMTAGTVLTLTQNWSDCSLYFYFQEGTTKKYSETLDSTRLLAGQTYTLTLNNNDWNGDCFGVSGAEAKARVPITSAYVKGNHDGWSDTAAGNVMTEVTEDKLELEGLVQQWEVTITFAAEVEFGIQTNVGWIGYSGLDAENSEAEVTTANFNFVLEAGTYKIILCSYEGYGNNKIIIMGA